MDDEGLDTLVAELLDALETLRAERNAALAREKALETAIRHVINDSPDTPDSVKRFLRDELASSPPAAEPEPGAVSLPPASASALTDSAPGSETPAAEPEVSAGRCRHDRAQAVCPDCGALVALAAAEPE